MENPATFSSSAAHNFHAPTATISTLCPELEKGTTYHVVIEKDSSYTSSVSVSYNFFKGTSAGSASGWTIPNSSQQYSSSTWADHDLDVPLVMDVRARLTEFELEALTETEVPFGWSLTPAGIAGGEKFRLMFLTDNESPTSTDIDVYNAYVQAQAAAGHADIQEHSSQFRVLGSTAAVDARDNTETTSSDTDAPIYWLNGTKVADNYADLYDETWDEEVNRRTAAGDLSTDTDIIWTGSEDDGTERIETSVSVALGETSVRQGEMDNSSSTQDPLSALTVTAATNTAPFYALSGIFVEGTPPTLDTATATTATTINLTFDEPLDSASIPAASAFEIQVGGTVGPVDSVEWEPDAEQIVLTVSTPMLSRDTITVSYTRPDGNPLQDPNRNEVESFSDEPIINAIRETFVSNLGQTGSTIYSGALATNDLAQRFDTGSTASFDFTEVEVLFKTAPSSTATVTAIIADGLGLSNNIVATLTNPPDWSTNPRFGIPSGTTLSKNTTYYLIIEATGGVLQVTPNDAEDSGAAANWTIGNAASFRAMVSDTGLGGSWVNTAADVSFQMAIRGKHHGNPGTPELTVTAKDQTLVLDVTVPDHGSSNLTGIEYSYKETTGGAYTSWAPVTGAISNSGGTFEIGGLNNGTEYTAQVQTVNDIGTSDPSNEDSATPDAPPAVTSIAITSDAGADKTYAIGDEIEFTLTFDKNLSLGGTDTSKPPGYITYQTDYANDDPDRDSPEADCVIGTDTKTLVCTHPILEGEYDADGIAVGANALSDFGSISAFFGPLGQRATNNNLAIAVDSNHKIDGVRPALTGARSSADKTKITLTFSEAIGAVDRTKITFQSGTTTLTTTADSISGSEVEITLTTVLTASDTNVTVALAADAVTDAVGNGNDVLAATAIVDETAPTLSETSTPSNTEVLLTYNEPLDPDSIPAASAFTVKVGGTSRTISTAAASGASGIVLTLSTAFRPGDTLTVSYTVPTLNPIQDIADNDAAALTDEAVSNTLPATAPEAVASLTASHTSTFGKVQLDWSVGTWANGSAITRHEVRYDAPIWSATLTVKDLGANFLGCDTSETNKGCEPGELLTDHTFSYDSRNYQIDVIDLIGGLLKLETNQTSNGISAAALADLTLHVGALSFPFADATHSSGILTWTGTGLSWSEDDMVPLAIRSFTPWTGVPDSAPGETNETSHTLEGLDPGEEYTFEVRAVNDVGGGGEASARLTLLAPAWGFTLRDSGGNDVTELTEGGDPATATVTITNASQATFGADQTITLEWGGVSLVNNRIQGAGNTSAFTILAGASTGHLDLSAHNTESPPLYIPGETHDLTAEWEGDVIGTIEQLLRIEDEDAPVARITDAPASVNEGDTIDIDIELSVRYPAPGALRFSITDSDSALSGTLPDRVVLSGSEVTATVTLTAAENTTQNDGARTVTFTLETSTDHPYTLGPAPAVTSVTIIVRDDDTPPLAVGNLRAQAGNTEATLRWEAPPAPTPDHGQPILHYEYRVKEGTGSFGSWAMIPNSAGTTTSHKFTGLTNEIEYTYEVRAENVAGDGAETDVSVTPRVGVAVSFGAAALSVDEGGTGQVTLTLAEAPATGTTVTVPITATPGEGLDSSEYSGVPSSVTFNAGETSKSFTMTAVQDTLDEPDEVLTLSLGTLPAGYVPGTAAELEITVVDDDVAELEFTLTRGGNNVTELTEGGASAFASVRITNSVRFSTDQTVTLEWGGAGINTGLIQGASQGATFDIIAGQANGGLSISAPDRPGDLYHLPETKTLTASIGGTQVGNGIELGFVDDEAKPVATMVLSPSFQRSDGVSQLTVVEGDFLVPFATVSRGYDAFHPGVLAELTGSANKFQAGTLQTVDGKTVFGMPFNLASATQSLASSLSTNDNSTAGDHSEHVFTIVPNPDYFTIGTPSSATLTILDNDAAPTAPRNLAARARDGAVVLTWDPPTSLSTTEFTAYELRHVAGSSPGGTFADISTDPETTTHTVTGLTNETEYTFELRAKNSFGSSSPVSVSKTPRAGVAVSFGAAALSVDEGGSAAVTLTLAEAPTASVTVQIGATPGAGLDPNEYSGVPSSVTFNAGETSKSFTVTTVDDTDDEPDRTLTLSLGTLPDGYVPGTHETLALTVADNDVPIVSVSFGRATASVTVSLSQAPEREVVVAIRATRGANLAADEYSGVPADVTFAADETSTSFTVTFEDDTAVEGNETLTLTFGTLPFRVNSAGANPQLVLTATDDDGPPAAPDVTVQTGDGYAELSWAAVLNDSPVLRYEVRWKEEGGAFVAWVSAGTDTSYRAEGLTNGKAHEFEVRAVNAHGDGESAPSPGTPTARLTGIPNAVQWLRVNATDSSRAELKWGSPANGTDKVTANSATATFSQIQGYRIEVCRTTCGDEANWYAVVPNTRAFEHTYVHQVLAPGVIRENHYRVRAININGKVGPWSNVATLDPTVVESFWLQTPNDSTLWLRFRVLNPDGNLLYVRYENTGTGAVAYTDYRLTRKGDVKLVLSGLEADSWYRVDVDFDESFSSSRMQSRWYGTAKEGHTPLRSPYAVDALDAQVWRGGQWREAPDNELYVRMGETGKYRVRLKPCGGIHDVIVNRIQSPAGRLRASPMDVDPSVMINLSCESEFDDWRRDENGNPVTMDQIYDMTEFPDRANDFIPIYAGTPNAWKEVTVTARALEDYPADRRYDALLSAPFAVVYNHRVRKEVTTTSSYLVSEGTGLVRISVDRPADATLPVPGGVTIGSGSRVMSWDAVPGATGYLVEWRYGPHYSGRANQDRSLQTATSVTLPLGGSGRGPITARVRAYSSNGVSAWSAELTWDSRPPTLNVLDTAVNEDDGSVGFLVTLDPAATGTVTVQYTTVDATAVAGTDYTATSGTLTFAPGERRKSTALVAIVDDGEEDSGETFRLVLSSPTGSDANNGAAVLGDAEAVATILNSEREVASLTGFTLVDAGTNADLMALADGVTVRLGELLASSYGIRANLGPGAAPGSVRLALSGAKTVARTDDAAPWSLYGDGAGRVNGGSLPPGSYTLTATAYADSGGRGDERGSLEVSFTVAAGVLSVTTPGPFTVAEGETAVAALAASDTGTGGEESWSIPAGAEGGADGAAFAATSEGVLSLVAAKDFEAPDDADGDGTYEVTVSVTAGTQTATAALSVTLADVDEPALVVTTAGPFTVAEGETAVAALAASDTGTGGEESWSIPAGAEGGADGAAFTATSEGMLSLVAAKDFEAPDDADGDGTYEVTVAVAVPASSMAGSLSATAALLVTLSNVNEAPVAKATASPESARQGAWVTLDGSASTDPDAGDTLTYLWTQADDGAPRVTLSDGSAEQPAFTSPSDLAAETGLGFTLRVTDPGGLYAEDTVTVTVTLVSEVSIAAAADYPAEGTDAVFRLTRAGSALKSLTIPVTVEETGAMLDTPAPAGATFAAGVREAELRVPTLADAVSENDSRVTVRLGSGPGWQIAPGAASASLTVLDDDVAPSVSAADVTIWSADMTVVEYGPRSIGAGTADLFSNQMGRAGLRAKWLWYDPVTRKLKLGFDDSLDDAELLTLHMGGVSLGFPDRTGGNSSFSLENVDISWTDGETLAVRVSKPSAETVSTEATLASLTVAGATLSPAFEAGVLVYRAVADAGAETVTVSAQANDDGATVAYGPAADADAELADHQVAVPDEGETLVVVTVTAADGTVRRYRVVVAPPAAGSNTAPTGAPTIIGTPQVGETLTADTSAINDEDGLENAVFSYQWISSKSGVILALQGETGSTYTLAPTDEGYTFQVRVTFTDDADNEESLTSEATVPVAVTVPTAPLSLTVTAGSQTRELDVSWQAPSSNGGSDITGYKVQWKESTDSWDTAAEVSEATETGTTHTITSLTGGVEYAVRVIASNDVGDGPASTEVKGTPAGGVSEQTVEPENSAPTGLPSISGTPQVDQTLTADTSNIDDEDGLTNVSYRYQWGAGGSDIEGATGSTYTLTYSEQGQTIQVQVTFTDDANNEETLTSQATVAVAAAPNREATGQPTISGTPQVDQTLTADTANIADEDGLTNPTFAYQWRGGGLTIIGATGSTYTLTASDQGKTITVRVRFIDDRNSIESRISNATTAVAAAPNRQATGQPTISGTPQVDQTLTADTANIADEDGLTNATFEYQWLAGGTEIAGATGSSYSLTSSEQDQTIQVRVSFTDDADNQESRTSAATGEVAAKPNTTATGLPTISGTAQVDRTLTADTSAIADEDGLDDVSYSYQWLSDDTAINGATGSSHTLTGADQGKTIKVKVSFTDDAENQESLTSEATDAVAAQANNPATGLPTISGTAEVGETLTADTSAIADEDGLSGVTYSYQWVRNDGETGKDINDATDSTHTLTDDDAGKTIRVRVLFTDDADNQESLASLATDRVAATKPGVPGHLRVFPHDTGALDVDWHAPASDGGSNITGYKVQWKESAGSWDTPTDVSEETATGTTHTITGLTDGVEYTVRVRAVNDAGEGSPSAEASGTPQEAAIWSATLTVGVAETFAGYSSFAKGEENNTLGALSSDAITLDDANYTVKALGVLNGKLILSVTPKLTDGFVLVVGTDEFASAGASTSEGDSLIQFQWSDPGLDWSEGQEVAVRLTAPDENTPATGEPTITGTNQVGETLTADTSAIADEDGLDDVSFSYQWIAGGTDIDGATASTYTLTYSEQGQTIQVKVSFTDDADNDETLTSEATVAVAAAPNGNATGLLTISGTPQVEETLTADTSAIADEDGLTNATFEYQWLAGGSDIDGATGSSYELTSSEQGQTIQVRVSFTDDRDNDETLTSLATVAVAAAPNRGATGAPTISGTPQVEQTLTADTSGISDADGLTNVDYRYQWIAGGTDIDGATGSSYLLTSSEQGKTIKVKVSFTDDEGNSETLTSAATAEVAAKANNPATGLPTISGTAQVGETLTADTADIADEDGLDDVTFEYQWLADGTDIDGAAGSSFTLTPSQQGKTIQVRVDFTDDGGNSESLTSAATEAVAAKPTPLTASFSGVPESHSGTWFEFTLTFSEEVKVSYTTLRDDAFTVSGGKVTKAVRNQKDSNLGWTIRVRPDGNGPVTIVLPATTDCDADGAICPGDGRKLSNRNEFTVSGADG